PVTRRLLSVLRGSAIVPSQALVNHADGKTVRLIRECGHYAGLTLHPDALSSERAVAWVRRLGSERLVFNSEMGSGAGDLTSVARSVHLMARGKLSESVSARVRWKNAVEFLHLPA
ncbi:MAG TPA: hydrolase TatD, partial [Myxococcaceae bacterium]|nr:hydrolase TatD [Myxococcaceae bacterium]